MLREVGFWHLRGEGARDDRPDPTALVDETWDPDIRQLVLSYVMRYGMIESYELAPSWCRFGCPVSTADPGIMGYCTLTDGTYCWPQGYAHYIQVHHGTYEVSLSSRR
jgi:hypothetical protein